MMTRYDRRFWMLAAGIAASAGYVDAVGFVRLGGFFVAFMSGNSTRFAVGLAVERHAALVAGALLAGFVAGVAAGTAISARLTMRATPRPLLLTGAAIALAILTDGLVPPLATGMLLAAGMGAANTVFRRDGEVSIGVTYMTGTLVKGVQRATLAAFGGPAWAWVPYLLMWAGLVGGACAGTIAHGRFGLASLWAAVVAMIVLAGVAAWLERPPPAGHSSSRMT